MWPRLQQHDARHASELGLERAPDAEIMALARDEGRTIITADLDYPRLLALGYSREPSLIPFRDGVWTDAEVIERMAELLGALAVSEIERSIIVVERHRIRRRRLPIVQSNSDE